MRANDLARLLSRDVESVVRLLLPNGKRVGAEWRVGGVEGEAGKSMGVHMTGDKAGVWLDGATGQSGDLVGLWMAVKGLSLRDACKEAADHLGVREDRIAIAPQRSYAKPSKQGVRSLSPEHLAWFTDTRKIPAATVEAFKVATRDGAIMFPYLRDGELVAAKYRKLPKEFRQDAGCEPSLFGWQALRPDARAVLICEGELDAMAWHTYGVPALSVPMGGGKGAKQGWIETEFDRLSAFDSIFVAMDDDAPGREAEVEIADRLGRERCRIVRLPKKDANECLIAGIPRETIVDCLRDSRTLDPSELRNAGEYEDAVWREYSRLDSGIVLPWQKTHDMVRLRSGEVSIWAGINSHGKSTVLSQVFGAASLSNVRCCVGSFEYRPAKWLMRLNRQMTGVERPTEAFSRAVMKSLGENLWVFDVMGGAKTARILEVMWYAVKRYQIDLFVIDNLTKCGIGDDDYPAQKAFIEALADFARATGAHVAVACHIVKADENVPPTKQDIKGSGGITDMADTVFVVWRNKPKEEAATRCARTGEAMPEKYTDAADTLLLIRKQRETGEEPTIALWYDKASTQYLAGSSHRPIHYVEFSAVRNVA